VRWRKVVADAGNRAGLLMCADLRAAVRVLVRSEKVTVEPTPDGLLQAAANNEILRELVRFAISDDYFSLREKLGIAAPPAAAARAS